MPNSAEVTTNIRPIEVKSYIANIEESVTPFKNAYMKYKIPTTVGDNFLNNKLKTTRVASAISEGNGSYEAKMRINQLVREIDKCIALLNN